MEAPELNPPESGAPEPEGLQQGLFSHLLELALEWALEVVVMQ